MSAQPQATHNKLTIDPSAFEQDYEYKRPYKLGSQTAVILEARKHNKAGTSSWSLLIVFGIASSAKPSDGSNRPLGGKIDAYIPLSGPSYKGAIAAIEPEALKGGIVNLDTWAGRKVTVDVVEEIDKQQSGATGVETKRPRIARDGIFALQAKTPAPAAAPASSAPTGTALL